MKRFEWGKVWKNKTILIRQQGVGDGNGRGHEKHEMKKLSL